MAIRQRSPRRRTRLPTPSQAPLSLNGSVVHPFIASAAGSVTATITAVDPSTSPSFGFGMGTWDGSVCTVIMLNNLATTSAALAGTVVAPSSLCVRLFDSQGNVPSDAPINYTVQVCTSVVRGSWFVARSSKIGRDGATGSYSSTSSSSRRLGLRRPTPRLDVLMNSTT